MSTNSLHLTVLVCDSAYLIIIAVSIIIIITIFKKKYLFISPNTLFFFLSALFKGAGPGDGVPGAETTLDSTECRWGGCEKEVCGVLCM